MNNTSRVTTLPDTWESRLLEENKYLKEFIGGVSIDEIKRLQGLEKENASLKAENKVLRDAEEKLASAHEETVKAIKAEAAARIEAANKAHADGSSRQRGVWESQVSELRFQNNKLAAEKLAANKEAEALRSEVSRLGSELKTQVAKVELLESIKSDTSQILDLVKELASKGATASEIAEAVENVSMRDKILALIKLESQGLKGPELLEQLRPYGVKAQSRVSELRKNSLYAELGGKAYRGKGGDKHVET